MSPLERPPWAQRRFAFVHPPWMLADFVERLRGLVPRLEPLLAGVGPDAAYRQHDGRWSIAQNVGHLSDVEDLWQERLEDLRQGRGVYTPAQPARFQAAAAKHQERTLEAIVAELGRRRARLVDALANAPASLQAAVAFHERLQTPMRLVDCAQFVAEHDDHHLLRIRVLRSIVVPRNGLEGKESRMLEKPQIVETDAQLAAVIRLTIPRSEIQKVMGPSMGELMATVAAQGIAPAGPIFSHHFKMDPNTFDFEVGVPVQRPVAAAGRVKPGQLPAAKVVRTVYQGPYEGLGPAWAELGQWIAAEGLTPAPNLWERYLSGPESSPDPATWRTELNRPLTR